MSAAHTEEFVREVEAAREREFESRLEQHYDGEPPVADILRRAASGGARRSRSTVWLAAAVVLLALGVTFALAWQARDDRGREADDRQDREVPIDLPWPQGTPRVHRPEQLQEIPVEASILSLGMPVYEASDLARFDALQQLNVRLTPSKIGKIMREGGPAPGSRLDVLATAPSLRRVSVDFLPIGPSDLVALRHLERLQVLELSGLIEIDDALRAAAAKGGQVLCSPFDAAFGEAVATHSRARTLRISGMPITVEGLRALEGAGLHTLILDCSGGVTTAALEALGELRSLRRLTLRSVHGGSVQKDAGGMITKTGSSAWSAAAMARIGALPNLESLALDTCYLDREVVSALPRGLRRLDLSTSFGVDAALADVVAQMERLTEIGLPLQMADAKDYLGMSRPWARDTDSHTRRLEGAVAARILSSRPWQALRLDGQITAEVATALSSQDALQALTMTPTNGSVPPTYIAALPKLERMHFVEADLPAAMLAPLNDSASLRRIVFEDCSHNRRVGIEQGVLRDGIEVRMVTRMVN